MHARYLKSAVTTLLALSIFIAAGANASSLEDFETEATAPSSSSKSKSKKSYTRKTDYEYSSSFDDDDDDWGLFDIFGELVADIFIIGGTRSFDRSNLEGPSTGTDITARKIGDIGLPMFRADGYFSNDEEDIWSKTYRVEAGYGPLAYYYRNIDLREGDANTQLELAQSFFSYRMAVSNRTTLNFNVGTQRLKGSVSDSDSAVGLSFQYHSSHKYGFEYSWTRTTGSELDISDHEVAATYSFNYFSARAGLRSLNAGSENINGAFAGIVLHF